MTLDSEDFKKAGITEQEADGIVNLPRNIAGVEISVYIRQRGKNEIKVSLRSNGKIEVLGIARKFGGGGHILAAGFETRKNLETVMREVIGAISDELHN